MIGIIFIGDLKYCPYLKTYTNNLDKLDFNYDVLYWSRENSDDNQNSGNYIRYKKKSKLNKSKYFKFFDFIGYKFWLNKQLKLKKYDKLIVLSTLSGIISFDFLNSKFKNKYIFDIRDYSYEHNRLFYLIEKRLIKNSYFTCISSEGFKNFLPKEFNYVNVHNFNQKDNEYIEKFTKKKDNQTLNIVWMGAVRYFSHQKKIIDRLKNDRRFNMIYHGSGPDLEDYIRYCEDNDVQNVIFTGEYSNERKSELIKDADIINNSYITTKTMEIKYAISNKYYDGINYKIPQLVETNTFKQSKVKTKGLGIAIDPEDKDFAEKIYNYYYNIDEMKFNNACDIELLDVQKENEYYMQKINEFILPNIGGI